MLKHLVTAKLAGTCRHAWKGIETKSFKQNHMKDLRFKNKVRFRLVGRLKERRNRGWTRLLNRKLAGPLGNSTIGRHLHTRLQQEGLNARARQLGIPYYIACYEAELWN